MGASLKSHILLLGIVGVLGLSACETFKGSVRDMSEMGSVRSSEGETVQPVNVQTRADRGDMAPMPTPSAAYTPPRRDPMATGYNTNYQTSSTMSNGSVSVFETMPGEAGYHHGAQPYAMQPMGSLPNYSGGVANFDPSVTIFPVDGPAPVMGGQQNIGAQYYTGGQMQGNQMTGGNNQVYFNHGSSRLGNYDRRRLSDLAEQAKFAPVNYVTVSGHASRPTQGGSNSVEGQISNLKQSMNRSFAVSSELIRKGVPADKIKTVSWGAAKATGTNTQDRRVDVIMGEQ